MTGDRRLATGDDAALLTHSTASADEGRGSPVARQCYSEDQLLPLSAVSQYVHCPRRCALIHLEQVWADNRATAEGNVLHEKAHGGISESRGDLKILRSLRLRSLRLGITGVADVVELHRREPAEGGVRIPGISGTWLPFPVEYKRGASKDIRCYEVQLCAQALCLEEMLCANIPDGALFLGQKQSRVGVVFDDTLRAETEAVCLAVQQLFAEGVTPPADYNKRCSSCSLFESCLPRSAGAGKSARRWLDRQIEGLCATNEYTSGAMLQPLSPAKGIAK
ncbi:MAG: CRISPR-associated protein Cas4 [Kiritimatiellae bacterium]|nr:CRISPR-associated protein Cas4 [Kiritimatiellia bacterium]